jgi:hypothetical protein
MIEAVLLNTYSGGAHEARRKICRWFPEGSDIAALKGAKALDELGACGLPRIEGWFTGRRSTPLFETLATAGTTCICGYELNFFASCSHRTLEYKAKN